MKVVYLMEEKKKKMKRRTQVGKELDAFHHTSSGYSAPCHDILMWNITAGSAALSGTAVGQTPTMPLLQFMG